MSSDLFFEGMVVGWAAQKIRNRRKRAEIRAELQARANSLQGRSISPPLPVERSFSAPGAFTFGLPQRFVEGDTSRWQGAPPTVLVVDGPGTSGMWLVVERNQNLTLEIDPGLSPWLGVVQPNEFRALARNWGGTVVAGPEAVLLGGEQAIWASYGMIEGGQENRKWVVFTRHRGNTFELIMGVKPETEAAYVDTFWTAVGSWRWADQAAPASTAEQAPVGLRSPDGRYWWDGVQWRPLSG
jgi:hypothetical protein